MITQETVIFAWFYIGLYYRKGKYDTGSNRYGSKDSGCGCNVDILD